MIMPEDKRAKQELLAKGLQLPKGSFDENASAKNSVIGRNLLEKEFIESLKSPVGALSNQNHCDDFDSVGLPQVEEFDENSSEGIAKP